MWTLTPTHPDHPDTPPSPNPHPALTQPSPNTHPALTQPSPNPHPALTQPSPSPHPTLTPPPNPQPPNPHPLTPTPSPPPPPEWTRRISCWVEESPLRAKLEECTVALSLQLASRFETLLGPQAVPVATPNLLANASPETGCEWVATLTFPQFPSFDAFKFSSPVLPHLIPWSVRKWQEIGTPSRLGEPQASAQQGGQVDSVVYAGIAAGGVAVGMLIMLGVTKIQRRSAPRLQLRLCNQKRNAFADAHDPEAARGIGHRHGRASAETESATHVTL